MFRFLFINNEKMFRLINPFPKFIDVSLYITTLCQYHCPYCYARYDYKDEWNRLMDDSIINAIYNGIKNNQEKFCISLLGGEPTLYPNLERVIRKFHDLDNVLKIELFTNSKQKINYEYPKLWINASFHPTEEPTGKLILDNIKNYPKERVTISLLMLKKYKKELQEFYLKCKELGITNYDVTYITSNKSGKTTFITDIIPELEHQKMYIRDNKELTLLDVFNGNNCFKNWNCELNDIDISVTGEITIPCTNETYVLNTHEIQEYFKRLKYRTIKCKYDKCDNPCWINAPKYE